MLATRSTLNAPGNEIVTRMGTSTRGIVANLLTFVVWLATAAFALYAVYLLHDLFFTVYARLNGEFRPGELIRMVLLIVLSLLAIAYIIASGEYHRKHVGKPKSLRLFGLTLVVELTIWLLSVLIGS